MQVINIAEIQNNFNTIFDNVIKNQDEIIVNRNGKENIVIIPFEEYTSLKETLYLLGNKNNAKHLLESIKQIEEGKFQQREIIE